MHEIDWLCQDIATVVNGQSGLDLQQLQPLEADSRKTQGCSQAIQRVGSLRTKNRPSFVESNMHA